jgi:diacylglycerol kinase family enzyme
MLVLLNPRAAGGRAAERWRWVEGLVRSVDPGCQVIVPETAAAATAVVADALTRGERRFVAAGGDGTVNLLVAALLARANGVLDQVTLGAVGLGSSNDFHKPTVEANLAGGIPCRLDFAAARPIDVCWLRCRTDHGRPVTRPWVINASIGATADGNRYFNSGVAPAIRLLRRVSPDAALAWAALRAVATNRPRPLTLALDGGPPFTVPLRNLGVVKNPHFTGVLRYDSPFVPDDGRFQVHALTGVSAWRLWGTLARLARGRFVGRPGTLTWGARRLTVLAPAPFAVEADGEVMMAGAAEFAVQPRALRVCP